MDSPVFVRHCLNATIIGRDSHPEYRGLVTFWEHFLRVAWRRPVPAFAALYWHLTRRRVRARNRLSVSSADLPFAYRLWIAKNENFDGGAEAVHSEIEEWSWHPRFSVVVHSSQTEQQVSRSIASVKSQTYPIWTCSQLPIDSAIASDCDFVIPLRAGDELSKSALFHYAEALQAVPEEIGR